MSLKVRPGMLPTSSPGPSANAEAFPYRSIGRGTPNDSMKALNCSAWQRLYSATFLRICLGVSW